MRAIDPAERLAAFLDEAGRDPVLELTGGSIIAVGWAAVDLERAAAELGAGPGFDTAAPVGPTSSEALGARALVLSERAAPGCALLVLEPTTEGRLAAILARHGEGPAVTWLGVGDPTAALEAVRRAGLAISVERPGPLGPERLVLDRPPHGPHHLLVGRPGTIHA